MKYKPHRGSLKQTMKEVREFSTLDEFKDFLEKGYEKPIKSVDFQFYAYDSRINWDLYCVNLVFEDGELLNNCAFTNSKLEE